MFAPNVDRVLQLIRPDDVVVDIGGWACPFNRADYVIDAEPYDTRGYYKTIGGVASQGGDREHFSAATWIQRDLCTKDPYPFADRSVDVVICSHTLEDLRDPLWVCAEMIRIAKRGYIEMPSRVAESCRGWEHPRIAGLSHHRWLVDIDGRSIQFLMKYHRIHSHWRLSLPKRVLDGLTDAERVQWLFWDGGFEFAERTIHGIDRQEAELERFVRATRPYPGWRLALDAGMRRVNGLAGRAFARLK